MIVVRTGHLDQLQYLDTIAYTNPSVPVLNRFTPGKVSAAAAGLILFAVLSRRAPVAVLVHRAAVADLSAPLGLLRGERTPVAARDCDRTGHGCGTA